jgi:hypothetical protein
MKRLLTHRVLLIHELAHLHEGLDRFADPIVIAGHQSSIP